jgi:hypothetical protein
VSQVPFRYSSITKELLLETKKKEKYEKHISKQCDLGFDKVKRRRPRRGACERKAGLGAARHVWNDRRALRLLLTW